MEKQKMPSNLCQEKSLMPEDNADQDSPDVFDLLERLAGTVEAPYDWATNHDYYLYISGVQK